MAGLETAVAIGFATVGEEHLFTFMLSSPGTVRKLYIEKGQSVAELQTDLNIALGLGIGFSLLLAYVFKSKATAWVGVAFGFLMYYIYEKRAGL